jgi:predicted dehydrogenase
MTNPQVPQQLRHAVIGAAAGVFKSHREALRLPEINLVAIADINATLGQQRADELGCAFYTDYHQMLASEHPDVVTIITPHPLHARIAIDCLHAGCHVLVEKPMAVQVAEADAMIEAAQQQQRLLGVIFQHRFRPEIRAARKLLQEGQLGNVQHVAMTVVWTRPAAYFQQASWRGTWSGEGGGVLMNQAQHNLDILCHLLGQPRRVFGWTRHQLHHIETEDTVQAVLEWSNGATGSLHISTAEADVPETLQIVGTRGNLEIKQHTLAFRQLDSDMQTFIATCPDAYAAPQAHTVPITLEQDQQGDHVAVYQNFYAALLHNGTFTSAGAEGRVSLELANSLIYSNYAHSETELPLDRAKYAHLLTTLKEGGEREAS